MSIWIAKLLGPVILVLSIPMLLQPKRLLQTTQDFLSMPPLVLISGVLAMVAGLAIVNLHNLWVWDWRVVVTLFGWALVLGGVFRVLAPRYVVQVGHALLQQSWLTRIAGGLWGLLGIFLCYQAYLAT